jgi:hypothetical protein
VIVNKEFSMTAMLAVTRILYFRNILEPAFRYKGAETGCPFIGAVRGETLWLAA